MTRKFIRLFVRGSFRETRIASSLPSNIVNLRRSGIKERNVATTTTSTANIKRSPAMKQEPKNEEDSYFDESSMPAASTTPPPPPTTLPPTALPPTSSSSSSSGWHGSVTHRVRSHARSLRAMANPSAVWAHFDLCTDDPLRAQCRICGAVVVRGGANPRQCGTTNLHRHLRVHHGGRLIGRRYHGKYKISLVYFLNFFKFKFSFFIEV